MWATVAIIAALLQLYGGVFGGWQNDYDQNLHFLCQPKEYLNRVRSRHDNRKEDRQWLYGCGKLSPEGALDHCVWHHHVNTMDGDMTFKCPQPSSVIAGVASYHNNHHEDRVFSFRCCLVTGLVVRECRLSGILNDYDGWMDYYAPIDHAIVGFRSWHNNHHEDRRWVAEICQLHTP